MQNRKSIKPSFGSASWRQAMMFVLLGLVLLFALQELLLFGLRHFDRENIGVMNRVALGKVHAEIIISGSSRAAYHYDPQVIQSGTGLTTFNLGRDGTKLHEQLDLLRVYLKKNPHPKYFLQNLDTMGLRENHDVTDGKQYIAWLEDKEISEPLLRNRNYYVVYRWLPIVGIWRSGGMESAIVGLLESGNKSGEFNGFRPQHLTWNRDFEKFKASSASRWKADIDPQKIQALSALVDICKTNGIRIILVYSPDFRASREFFENRDEILAVYKGVAARLNVPFWDYSDSPICEDRKYFYNSQHMNAQGAAIFSQAVAQRLAAQIADDRRSNTQPGIFVGPAL